MAVRIILLTGAILGTACAGGGPALREPVGQTTTVATTPMPRTDAASGAAAPDAGPNDVGAYLAGKIAGPCATNPAIVEFNGSSTELADAQVQALQRLAGCLNAAPYDTASVVLVGYTNVVGTMSANLELGLASAQVVMRQLMSNGVAPGRFVVSSAGELQRPHARWGLHAHRVEVLLARGGPPRPNEAPTARGIDVEGLVPRPRQGQAAQPSAPPVRPSPPPNAAPPPRRR